LRLTQAGTDTATFNIAHRLCAFTPFSADNSYMLSHMYLIYEALGKK